MRLPLAAEPLLHAREIENALSPKTVVGEFVRDLQESLQRRAEGRCWLKRRETQRVDQHQRGQQTTLVRRETRGNGTAQCVPHQHRRLVAGAFDEIVEPACDTLRSRRFLEETRCSVSRQVRRNYTVGGDERGNHTYPLGAVGARAVQQHDGFSFAAFQNGSPYTIEHEPTFSNRQAGNQLLTRIAGQLSGRFHGALVGYAGKSRGTKAGMPVRTECFGEITQSRAATLG